MPQMSGNRVLVSKITARISALYQMHLIDSAERNKLAKLTKEGISNNFDSLYRYIGSLPAPHPLLEEMREMILFG